MARVKTYRYGQAPRLSAEIKVSGTATDPSNLTFWMREPDGTETEYVYGTDTQLVKDSTGNYHVDWKVDQEGIHTYRFYNPDTVAAGTAVGADEWTFVGERTLFAP